ncbi:MAG: HAD family hydrolase [Bacillota bacterium]|jgi:phosphoglycolate phosphatase|nr:HAD family hydrolase [Clostridia bacterium]
MSLVMFDYDGVIADSLDVHVKSFLAAFQENGYTQFKTAQDIINLYEDNVYRSMGALGMSDEDIDRVLASYKEKQDRLLEQIELFPHMAEFFREISIYHKVYIITSNTADAVLRVLDKKGIIGVEKVIGFETEKSKIKKIRLAMSWHPELKAYYVGDTKGDIYEGRQAGTVTVGVAWGWHSPDKLKESNPDYLVYSPRELIKILREKA